MTYIIAGAVLLVAAVVVIVWRRAIAIENDQLPLIEQMRKSEAFSKRAEGFRYTYGK